jgi:uracil-DNA glycosylase
VTASAIAHDLAQTLVATLPAAQPTLYNPYRDACVFDTADNGPAQRLARLAQHLDCAPRLVLIGEAPGYQGCRYSGIAFTSERLLIEGAIPRLAPLHARLSQRRLPFSEPSATIVWKTLYRLGLAEHTILWNAVQLHPHKPGEPWSNRTPHDAELQLGQTALQILRSTFPAAQFVAVGNKANLALTAMGIHAPLVRHPANGGATQFAEGLAALSGIARANPAADTVRDTLSTRALTENDVADALRWARKR